MRRLLLVFLMLLMPLQSVWSAAASVCQHEQTKTSHFGHHDVHHDESDATAVAAESSSDNQGLSGALDNDHHHALNLHPVPFTPMPVVPVVTGQQDHPGPSEPYSSASIAALERPPQALADALRQGF